MNGYDEDDGYDDDAGCDDGYPGDHTIMMMVVSGGTMCHLSAFALGHRTAQPQGLQCRQFQHGACKKVMGQL